MLILFDECVPRPLRRLFTGHQVRTVQEMGWVGKENGELLALIQTAGFDVLITVDQNVPYQQNLQASGVSIVIMIATSNRIEDLEILIPAVMEKLDTIQPGEPAEIKGPEAAP